MHALLHEMSIYQLFVSIKFDSLKKSLVSCITCTCEWLKIYEDAIVCSICTINKEEQEGEKKKVTAHIIQKQLILLQKNVIFAGKNLNKAHQNPYSLCFKVHYSPLQEKLYGFHSGPYCLSTIPLKDSHVSYYKQLTCVDNLFDVD